MKNSCLLTVLLIYAVNSKMLDTNQQLASRQKRFLIYENLGINWIQMVVGVGLPIDVRGQSLTWGFTLKSYYVLPTNSSTFTNPTYTVTRIRRNPAFTSRYTLYDFIVRLTKSVGYENGRSCLLRTICEVASTPFDRRTGLLPEILHILLTPSSTPDDIDSHVDQEYITAEMLGKEGNVCPSLFPHCGIDILRQYTKLLT